MILPDSVGSSVQGSAKTFFFVGGFLFHEVRVSFISSSSFSFTASCTGRDFLSSSSVPPSVAGGGASSSLVFYGCLGGTSGLVCDPISGCSKLLRWCFGPLGVLTCVDAGFSRSTCFRVRRTLRGTSCGAGWRRSTWSGSAVPRLHNPE